MKILLVQTAFIGDVILATSMVEMIRSLPNKNIQIDFLVRNGNESLLANNPHISNVLVWNKKKKFRSLFSNLLKIRKNKYDAVVNIQRFMNSGILTGLSKAKYRIGFSSNPASALFTHKIEHKIPHLLGNGEYLHEVQRNAQLLEPLFNIDIHKASRPALYFNPNIDKKIQEIIKDEDYVVLAPTSVWFTKQWSAHKWSELSKELSKSLKLFFIGAPADSKAIDSIIGDTQNCVNLAGKLSLLESARLMKDARRVFVNDSAPLHLASSVDAKTTAIFCSTVPEFGYTPLSSDSKVITTQERLECQPCGLHGKKQCPLGHFKCSNLISIEQVASTVK
ncbi:MAG: glycosyltransferase family 9 protein [Bacteriovoracaceae bacterium]|nr:glycosyltransferase family 9 protein [Bacteriovoracaceae bacterium]